MIEKIESPEVLNSWEKRDIFTVRILSLLKSYSTKYHFCSFYRQIIDGKVTAVMSSLDRNFTLSVDEGFNNEELVRFFCLNGYNSILSDDSFNISPRYDEGCVMISSSKFDNSFDGYTIDEFPKLMDEAYDYDFCSVHPVDRSLYEQDFKAWYVDISHRVRHKTAKAYILVKDGETISSGILSSMIDNYSILTAVRTEDEYRRMGYGSALVSAICSDVKGYVYIMRDSNANEKFYSKLGFKNTGKWRMYK